MAETVETIKIVKNNADIELELTFNEDVMLDIVESNNESNDSNNESNDSNNNQKENATNLSLEQQYSPVSDYDMDCYSLGATESSIEGQTESPQNLQKSESSVNEEVVHSDKDKLSKTDPTVRPTSQESIEKVIDLSKSSEEVLNTSREAMKTSETSSETKPTDESNKKDSEPSSAAVKEPQPLKDSDYIEIGIDFALLLL